MDFKNRFISRKHANFDHFCHIKAETEV